jgi:hypothetical protein
LSLRKDISDEDYIFVPDVPKRMRKKYLSPETFSNKFSKIVLKLGLDKQTEKGQPKELRLYCLRKYWFKYMKAESTFKNFWFCHKTVNDHYITRDIEVHRQEYAKYYNDLRIYEPPLASKFLSPEEFRKVVIDYLKTEDGQKLLSEAIKNTLIPTSEILKKIFEAKS